MRLVRAPASDHAGIDELEAQFSQDDGEAGFHDALGQAADEQKLRDLTGPAGVRGDSLQFRHHQKRRGSQQQHRADVMAS